jgi:hypothetical protein
VNQAQAAAAVVPDIPPRELAIRNAMNFVVERPANREIDTNEVVRQVEVLMAIVEERNHHQRTEEDRIRRERDRDELLALFDSRFDDKVKMQLQEKDEEIKGLKDNIKALQKELDAKNLIIQNLQKNPIITEDISTPLQQRRNKEGLLAQEKDFTELNLKMPGSIEPQKSEGEKVDKKVLEETEESIRKLLEAITPTLIHAQQCNKTLESSGSLNSRLSFFSLSDIPQKLLDSEAEDNNFISVMKMSN